MLKFKDFTKYNTMLNEGGNVTAINYKTGEESRAEKIPIAEIGIEKFREKMIKMFKKLNDKFNSEHGYPIWLNTRILENGYAFNGSTSFIMDPKYDVDEIAKYKPSAGDIDIAVPENIGKDLFNTLDKLLGKEVIPGVSYMGSNRLTASSAEKGQINAVFRIDFDGIVSFAQVDFELLPFAGALPTEWAKFSHGSSFEDTKKGIKAVHHKYLIRSIVGSASLRTDIVIATGSSTPSNLRLKQKAGKAVTAENMMKFSVTHGIRVAFEPMLDDSGKPMYYTGPETGGKKHQVLKELETKDSTFATEIESMFALVFGDPKNKSDLNKMYSFAGVIDLMKKYLDKGSIERTNARYVELLWGVGQTKGQELERDEPQRDLDVKKAGYDYFVKNAKVQDLSSRYIDLFYQNFGRSRK